MSKFTRQLSIVVALVLLFGGAFLYQFMANQRKPPKRKALSQAYVRPVPVMKVQNEKVTSDLVVQGRLVAFDKIDVFTEVSGRLIETAKPFKVGSYFTKGSTLLKIDDKEAKLALLSQKSNLLNAIAQILPDLKIDYPESFPQWNAYVKSFDLEKPIQALPEPLTEQEQLFIISKNLTGQYYNIQSQEERLSKYVVYAPFSGVITASSINPGALVRSGQKMGELMNKNNYELEATVRLADLKFVQVGNTAQFYSTDLEGAWTGRVKRISDQIDPNTQTVFVYISVSGPNLREGMYLRGDLKGKTVSDAIEIPRSLIVNQNSVFIIEQDSILQLQPIEVLSMSEEKAIVRGLEDGQMIMMEMFSGAYNGLKVKSELIEPDAVSSLK